MNQTLQGLPTGLSRTGCCSLTGLRSGYVAAFTPLLWILCQANLSFGAEPAALQKEVVAVSTSWSASGVKAGGLINLAIILDIQEPYHINANTAQDPFIPTSIQLESGPGFVLSSTAVFPDALEIDFGIDGAKERIKVFSGRTVAYLPMVVDGSAVPGKHEIKIRMRYQACNDTICLPPVDVIQSVELNLVPANTEIQITQPELFQALDTLRDRLNVPFFGLDFQIAPSKLWLLLMIAAVGGFLLNLTPCVLPLIPIKILSLAKTSGDRRRCFLLGLTLSFGVVAFWMGLAIAISNQRLQRDQ